MSKTTEVIKHSARFVTNCLKYEITCYYRAMWVFEFCCLCIVFLLVLVRFGRLLCIAFSDL